MKLNERQGIIAVGAKIIKQEGIDPSEYQQMKEGKGLLLARLNGFSAVFYYQGNAQVGSHYRSETVDQITVEDVKIAPRVLLGCHMEDSGTQLIIPSHLKEQRSEPTQTPSETPAINSEMEEYKAILQRSRGFSSAAKVREFDAGSLQDALLSTKPRKVEVKPMRIQFETSKVVIINDLSDQIDPEFMVRIALEEGIIEESLFA